MGLTDDDDHPPTDLQAVPPVDDEPQSEAPPGFAGFVDDDFDDDADDAPEADGTVLEAAEDDPDDGFDDFDRADIEPEPPKVTARQQKLFDMGGLDGDSAVTVQNIIDEGDEIELTASLGAAEVPLKGGLVDPNERVRLFVTAEYAGKVDVPVRDRESREVESWKVRAKFRPTRCESIESAMRDENTGLLALARQILAERGELNRAA